jgi:hypothetical protein
MTKIIVASGQSNMTGRGVGGAWDMPANLKLWNNENELSDSITGIGTQSIAPTRGGVPFHGMDNNLAIQAAGFWARQISDPVRLLLSGRGGRPISDWHDGVNVGPQLNRLLAVWGAASKPKWDYFLWHQGENGTSVAGWNGMIAVLMDQGAIDADTPVVIGMLAPQFTTSNAILEQIAGADPRIRLARISDLPKEADGIHFSGPSLVTAGLAYAGLMAC